MSSITISYKLSPPAQTEVGSLSSLKDITFPVNASPSDGQGKYYHSLQKAIRGAKDELGNDLTAWRDAVGQAELKKETPRTLKYDEAGEEEEDEEDEQ